MRKDMDDSTFHADSENVYFIQSKMNGHQDRSKKLTHMSDAFEDEKKAQFQHLFPPNYDLMYFINNISKTYCLESLFRNSYFGFQLNYLRVSSVSHLQYHSQKGTNRLKCLY